MNGPMFPSEAIAHTPVPLARPVTLVAIGRFHHFHLARQLEKHGLLKKIWTGYPRFKLKSEEGIPEEKIETFPWLQAPYMARGRLGFPLPEFLDKEWRWRAQVTLDLRVSRTLAPGSTLIALSGSGLRSGRRVKQEGGAYICDRGSSHIRFQDRILREEHARWGLTFSVVDSRMIAREETEYALADYVSVPSTFVANSFVAMGHPVEKLFLNPYGARLERFHRVAEPAGDTFTVAFVGQASIRKGFLYLLEAFGQLKHPRKKLNVIGSISSEIKPLLEKYDLSQVEFVGVVPNDQLPYQYSTSHVMVLPSIEEGLAMVIGEALACGCPVIASEHTGANDFFTDGVEGFIVPIRCADSLLNRLERLAEDAALQQRMSKAALQRVSAIGGWNAYGERWKQKLLESGSHGNAIPK
ncbi:MAG: glycosyltransferase family 4 protein [Panacagrimonas sp.]